MSIGCRILSRCVLPVCLLMINISFFSDLARGAIVNGDFSSGNAGFTSGYGFGPTGGGHYTIGSNPHSWNSALSSYGDHTTGSGLMLIADGSGTANTAVWSESVGVVPNSQYTFAFWASSNGNDNNNGIDPSPANLRATANGVAIGSSLAVPQTNGVWSKFAGSFNSGASSSVTLSITDLNTNGGAGNDFAIDDISIVPEPASISLLLSALVAYCASRLRRRL